MLGPGLESGAGLGHGDLLRPVGGTDPFQDEGYQGARGHAAAVDREGEDPVGVAVLVLDSRGPELFDLVGGLGRRAEADGGLRGRMSRPQMSGRQQVGGVLRDRGHRRRGERMVDDRRAGVGDVLDASEVVRRQAGLRQRVRVGHDPGAVDGGVPGTPEEERGVEGPVRETRVVQQLVQRPRGVDLPAPVVLLGPQGRVLGVQLELELVEVGGSVHPAEPDGLGVVGGVDEVQVDVELVTGLRQRVRPPFTSVSSSSRNEPW